MSRWLRSHRPEHGLTPYLTLQHVIHRNLMDMESICVSLSFHIPIVPLRPSHRPYEFVANTCV